VLGAVLGGMVGRVALMLGAVVVGILGLGLPRLPLVASLLGYFMLFLVLAYRGVRLALRAPDATGALIATGVTTWLVFQAWVNMAVVASLIPMTGITLPFISYGGSSLLANGVVVGLLLALSDKGVEPPPPPRPPGRRLARWVDRGAR